jgi:hypothetical protein
MQNFPPLWNLSITFSFRVQAPEASGVLKALGHSLSSSSKLHQPILHLLITKKKKNGGFFSFYIKRKKKGRKTRLTITKISSSKHWQRHHPHVNVKETGIHCL